MKQLLKIAFSDFYTDFDAKNNFLISLLQKKYDIQVVDDFTEPVDLLFYSFQGTNHYKWGANPIRIYFTGENDVPNFNECDYAISFHRINFGDRHLRLPLYCLYGSYEESLVNYKVTDKIAVERDFCSVVMSNSMGCDPQRISLIDRIASYKNLSYGGNFRNNVGGRVLDKKKFCNQFKFNIAAENSKVDGYITEKIYEAFQSYTVPIYWGADDVVKDFNPDSFINVCKFKSLDDALDYIIEIDSNDELYLKMLHAQKFPKGSVVENWESILSEFLDNIICNRKKYITLYGCSGNYWIQSLEKNIYFESLFWRRVIRAYDKTSKYFSFSKKNDR